MRKTNLIPCGLLHGNLSNEFTKIQQIQFLGGERQRHFDTDLGKSDRVFGGVNLSPQGAKDIIGYQKWRLRLDNAHFDIPTGQRHQQGFVTLDCAAISKTENCIAWDSLDFLSHFRRQMVKQL